MKYAIDSNGAMRRSDNQRRLADNEREQALNAFAAEFFGGNTDVVGVAPKAVQDAPQLSATGGNTDVVGCRRPRTADNTDVFILMNRTIEGVWFFTKTKLSSSSQAVKLANELDFHSEIVGNKRAYLQSIYPNDNNVSDWYYLGVGGIEFERNIYDGEYIDVRYRSPVPYARFMYLLGTEFKNYKALNIGLELNYPKALLEKAVDYTEAFCTRTNQALEQYKREHGFEERYRDSNRATNCIAAITEYKDNCFPVYQQVKNCIKKAFTDAYNIRYKGNKITAQLDESYSDTMSQGDCPSDARMRRTRGSRTLALYVVSNDPVLLILGGKVINNIESFKDVLTSPALFEEAEWFTQKVKPVIEQDLRGE